jgi:hypothetical protein
LEIEDGVLEEIGTAVPLAQMLGGLRDDPAIGDSVDGR